MKYEVLNNIKIQKLHAKHCATSPTRVPAQSPVQGKYPLSPRGGSSQVDMPELCAQQLDLAIARWRSLAAAHRMRSESSASWIKTKMPEVTLRLFDRPSSRKVWAHYAIKNAVARDADKNKNAGGNPPAFGGPSIRRVRFARAAMHPSLLKQFSTDLLEVILLESVSAAKEFEIGLGLLASFKLGSRKLYATYVIGSLGQQIVPRRCVFKNSCLASNRALDSRVHCLSDDTLTPVVINLYLIESLQISKMRSKILRLR